MVEFMAAVCGREKHGVEDGLHSIDTELEKARRPEARVNFKAVQPEPSKQCQKQGAEVRTEPEEIGQVQ